MTAFLVIRDSVRAALQGIPALASGRISTDPGEVLGADELDDITVSLEAAQGARNFASRQPIDWQTDVTVTCRARTHAGVDSMARADQLLSAVWQRLIVMPYPAGVADIELQPAINFQASEGETSVAAVALVARFSHRTQALSLDGAS